jgi:hypothetical protein
MLFSGVHNLRHGVICLTVALASSASACARESSHVRQVGPVPSRITKDWYLRTFPSCIDPCDRPQLDSLWLMIRSRPDLLQALIDIAEDATVDALNRSNAILTIGMTNQERGYSYVAAKLERIPASEDASEWVLSLGHGFTKLPDFAYDLLAEQFKYPDRVHPASVVLSHVVGTQRARRILEDAKMVVDSDRRGILRVSAEWVHRPERE